MLIIFHESYSLDMGRKFSIETRKYEHHFLKSLSFFQLCIKLINCQKNLLIVQSNGSWGDFHRLQMLGRFLVFLYQELHLTSMYGKCFLQGVFFWDYCMGCTLQNTTHIIRHGIFDKEQILNLLLLKALKLSFAWAALSDFRRKTILNACGVAYLPYAKLCYFFLILSLYIFGFL